MNHLCLFISFVAIGMASASVIRPPKELCIPLPECPPQNNDTYTLHVPHKQDCSKFYKCDNGCGYLMECPFIEGDVERLLFHVELQICDWAVNVPQRDCLHRVEGVKPLLSELEESSSRQPTYNLHDLDKSCPLHGKKFISHENDCHYFYECDDGKKTLEKCSENLVFNPFIEACDYESSVGCIKTGDF